MFLEVQNKNVVKYDVYWDIYIYIYIYVLLVGPIYVTTYLFFKKTRNSHHPANSVIQAYSVCADLRSPLGLFMVAPTDLSICWTLKSLKHHKIHKIHTPTIQGCVFV